MATCLCDGCSQRFCGKHLDEHRKNLEKEFDQIETNHDELRQMFNDQKHSLMNEIDQCREQLINYIKFVFLDIEKKIEGFS